MARFRGRGRIPLYRLSGADYFAQKNIAVEAVTREEYTLWLAEDCPLCRDGAPLEDLTASPTPKDDLGGPPVDPEWGQIEPGLTLRQEVRLRLTECAGELEPMSGTRARHEHLRVVRVKVDDEIVVRGVGEDANVAFADARSCQVREHRSKRGPQRPCFSPSFTVRRTSSASGVVSVVHDGSPSPRGEVAGTRSICCRACTRRRRWGNGRCHTTSVSPSGSSQNTD